MVFPFGIDIKQIC